MSMTMANETWQQIPVGVKMRLGAREPIGTDELNEAGVRSSLHFTVGNGRKGLFKVIIKLMASDTYDVKMVKFKRKTYEQVVLAEASDVYNDMLGEVLIGMEKHLS